MHRENWFDKIDTQKITKLDKLGSAKTTSMEKRAAHKHLVK